MYTVCIQYSGESMAHETLICTILLTIFAIPTKPQTVIELIAMVTTCVGSVSGTVHNLYPGMYPTGS